MYLRIEEQEAEIEAGRYYLSQDYWVVLAKTTERISLEGVDKLSELSDKFEIRKDIRTEVDAVKEAEKSKDDGTVYNDKSR